MRIRVMQRVCLLLLLLVVSFLPASAQRFTTATGGGGGCCVTLGIFGNTGPAGWTAITATPITTGACTTTHHADGTCVVYISAAGNDSTCDLVAPGDLSKPCASIGLTNHSGINLLRQGKPDWAMLRMGDTWTESNQMPNGMSGTDANHPSVFACYDPANATVPDPFTCVNRPIIRLRGGAGCRKRPLYSRQRLRRQCRRLSGHHGN